MAAEHQAEASEAISQQAQAWLAAFVQNYPCSHCATHFLDICEAMPPQTKSREDYAVWWCQAHNKVNEALMNQPTAQFHAFKAFFAWLSPLLLRELRTIPCDPKQLIAAGLGAESDARKRLSDCRLLRLLRLLFSSRQLGLTLDEFGALSAAE
ncbi:ERV2 [Symbiodinium sp. CCMP2592]|nr:ERV2 [Symbiodinium sp. CCMP2592]